MDEIPNGTVRWTAHVKAPQGGPTYVHDFEDTDPAALLRSIADALDLSRADHITIRMQRGEKY